MSIESFERLPEAKKEAILSAGIREFAAKPFTEASTDLITSACSISKGLLFHYFGSKKDFYLYCLDISMQRLTRSTPDSVKDDFYGILFDTFDRKMALCLEHPGETALVNMASRDVCSRTSAGKAEVFGRYADRIREESGRVLDKALGTLTLRDSSSPVREGLGMYVNAVINRYLREYQHRPGEFFVDSGRIKREMRGYIDLMLYGITE